MCQSQWSESQAYETQRSPSQASPGQREWSLGEDRNAPPAHAGGSRRGRRHRDEARRTQHNFEPKEIKVRKERKEEQLAQLQQGCVECLTLVVQARAGRGGRNGGEADATRALARSVTSQLASGARAPRSGMPRGSRGQPRRRTTLGRHTGARVERCATLPG